MDINLDGLAYQPRSLDKHLGTYNRHGAQLFLPPTTEARDRCPVPVPSSCHGVSSTMIYVDQ